MTTFTTEDREWAYWNTYDCPRYSEQTEIKFFWPLTEQMELDLDYGPTHLHYRAKGVAGIHSIAIRGSTYEFAGSTLSDSVGYLNIGGISIGLKKKPNAFRRLLHKILGFNWKDSNGN